MIPYWVIAAGAFWSVFAWVLFAHALKRGALRWLAIPCFILGCVYTWFSFTNVPVELRAVWVRGTLAVLLYAQAPILTVVALVILFTQKGRRHDD